MMARREEVRHKGKVIAIGPRTTTVLLQTRGACSACHAAGLCWMGEAAEKAVEVPTHPFPSYQVGDEVDVVLTASMGMKAVWIGYFLPLVVLLAVALGLLALGVGDAAAGLSGIGAVGVYYLGLWLLRDRLRQEYVFTIQ